MMEGNRWGLQGMSWRYQGSTELERVQGEAGGAGAPAITREAALWAVMWLSPRELRCDSGFVVFVFNEGLGMETIKKLYNMRVDLGQLGSTGLKDEDIFLLIS